MKAAMLERTKDSNKVREDITKLIYLYLATHDFFRHFPVKKKSLSLPAERLLAYIFSDVLMWMQYVKRVCGKNVSSHRTCYTPWRSKQFENLI